MLQQRCHKLQEMPRPLCHIMAFDFVLLKGGTSAAASAVSSTAEKLMANAEHGLHQTEALQLGTLPLHAPGDKGELDPTPFYISPGPQHLKFAFVPQREADGLSPHPTKSYEGQSDLSALNLPSGHHGTHREECGVQKSPCVYLHHS